MNGIFNYIKPPGITSNDAVVDFKRLLGIKKVGHAGTLDPAAAGVLPITIGRGTRLFDYLLHSDKVYIGEILLGVTTDTFDTSGTVLKRSPAAVSESAISGQMSALTGEIMQTPPMYSAIKHGGKKLYQLARKGEKAEVAPRPVTVYAFDLLEMTASDRVRFCVRCSKGTYIRALAHDLGAALGCGACLALLVRTQSGSFAIRDALTFEQIRAAYENDQLHRYLIAPDKPLLHYPAIGFPETAEPGFRNGMALPLSLAHGHPPDPQEGMLLRLYCGSSFIGLGRIIKDDAGCWTARIHCMLT
ncbi:MAG: tRNA pseudouridine(55) synthase TruB [Bacillota bacterium]